MFHYHSSWYQVLLHDSSVHHFIAPTPLRRINNLIRSQLGMDSSQSLHSNSSIHNTASLLEVSTGFTSSPGVSSRITKIPSSLPSVALAPRLSLPSSAGRQLRLSSFISQLSSHSPSVPLKLPLRPLLMSSSHLPVNGPPLPDAAGSLSVEVSPTLSIPVSSASDLPANTINLSSSSEPQPPFVVTFASDPHVPLPLFFLSLSRCTHYPPSLL